MKNNYWKLLKNDLGFSLPEVMIGGSILVGVGLASATLFKNQTSAQVRVEYDQMLNQYHSSLSKVLENDHNCNATMRSNGSKYGSASLGSTDDISGVYLCDTTNPINTCNSNFNAQTVVPLASAFMQEGDWIDKQPNSRKVWRLTQITYPTPPVSKSGALTIRFEYALNPLIGTRTIKKDTVVNVRFNDDASNSGTVGFIECFNAQESSVNNLQNDVCKSLFHGPNNLPNTINTDGQLSYWDASTQACRLRGSTGPVLKDCTAQGMMVEGIRPDGTVHCRSISQGFDPAPIVNSTPCAATANVKLVWDGTQLRITCL